MFRICLHAAVAAMFSSQEAVYFPVVSPNTTPKEANIFPRTNGYIIEQHESAADRARFCQMPQESSCIVVSKMGWGVCVFIRRFAWLFSNS